MALADSILKARDCAARLADLRRKAVSPGGAVASALAGDIGGGAMAHRENLGQHAEQYRHFTGWVYAAIKAIAFRIAGQTIHVGNNNANSRRRIKSLGEQDEALESHPLLDTFADPNPLMVGSNLMSSTVASLLITGKSYWWMMAGDGGIQIWPIPSHWCEPADRLRTHWLVRPPGRVEPIEVPREQIALFRLVDPSDPFGAVSPLQSQARAVVADDTVQTAQITALNDGIHPSVILKAGKMIGSEGQQLSSRPILTQEQKRQLTNAIHSAYSGSINHRKNPVIIDGLIEDIIPWMKSPQEMDFLNSSDSIRGRILQAFSINGIILGQVEGANRASAVVAQESFATNVVNPLITIIGETITKWVCPLFARPNEKLKCWIEPARPSDPEQTLKEWVPALNRGCVTPNEYRRVILGLPELPGLDEPIKLPAPPAARPAGGKEGDQSADDDGNDDAEDRAAKRLAASLVYGANRNGVASARMSRNGRH